MFSYRALFPAKINSHYTLIMSFIAWCPDVVVKQWNWEKNRFVSKFSEGSNSEAVLSLLSKFILIWQKITGKLVFDIALFDSFEQNIHTLTSLPHSTSQTWPCVTFHNTEAHTGRVKFPWNHDPQKAIISELRALTPSDPGTRMHLKCSWNGWNYHSNEENALKGRESMRLVDYSSMICNPTVIKKGTPLMPV